MNFESKYSEESTDNFWDEIHRQEKELKEIKARLDKSFYKDKKEHCDCHKKVLSHGHNPCFDHKHGHHHNKCSCNHKGQFHEFNPCLDHKHGHHHDKCFSNHHGGHGHGNHHSSCFSNHHGHGHGNHHSPCFSNHYGHGHCEDFFLVDHCCGPKAFSHNNCCNKHFSLHLAGLTGDLNFQFFRKKGCCAKVEFECASETKSLVGRVCAIGIDFVDILKNDKTVVTIMKKRICTIHWLDKCDHHSYLPLCEDDEEVEEVVAVEEVEEVEAVEEIDASIKSTDVL